MNSIIYDMKELSCEKSILSNGLLIFAVDDEERSQFAINQFIALKQEFDDAIILVYDEKNVADLDTIDSIVKMERAQLIQGFPKSQLGFIKSLRECKSLYTSKNIIIDISCILTPYLFLLIKCIQMWNKEALLYVINTVPFDYKYTESPFAPYRSYYGNLKMEEIIGFSSSKGMNKESDLFIFAGFEGALALKVEEDTEYKTLYIVNALPSYYQKYKDISIINNYQLIVSKNCKRLYVPALNPFEVYNILDKELKDKRSVSIAPLCTKPIALGICMYALEHENVRIIYPFSDKYEIDNSHDVYKSYVYKILITS